MAVVIGYGPSVEGEAALEAGLTVAKDRGTTAIVVISQRRTDGSDDAAAQLDGLRDRLTHAGSDAEVRTPDLTRDPVEELLAVAAEVAAEVIVIGLRRRSPVGKLILGTSAQRILLDAACPVLAVKSPTS